MKTQNLAEQLQALKDKTVEFIALVENRLGEYSLQGDVGSVLAELKSMLAHSGPPALLGMESLKEEREKQWGNEQEGKAPRGWDRYRCTTFLEVIGAKIDRALQANQHIQDARADSTLTPEERQKKISDLEFDGIDSARDGFNYLRKCIQKIEERPDYYTNNTLP